MGRLKTDFNVLFGEEFIFIDLCYVIIFYLLGLVKGISHKNIKTQKHENNLFILAKFR